jgi:hypothetical protein
MGSPTMGAFYRLRLGAVIEQWLDEELADD